MPPSHLTCRDTFQQFAGNCKNNDESLDLFAYHTLTPIPPKAKGRLLISWALPLRDSPPLPAIICPHPSHPTSPVKQSLRRTTAFQLQLAHQTTSPLLVRRRSNDGLGRRWTIFLLSIKFICSTNFQRQFLANKLSNFFSHLCDNMKLISKGQWGGSNM